MVELQDYYDVYGHIPVPQGYKGGRGKDLGVWVKRIHRAYQRRLEHPLAWVVPVTLSKLRIERLEAMGF
jgi:hypothetical protein